MTERTKDPRAIYEMFYKRELSSKEYAEMKFNLVRYIELLIVLDEQRHQWLEQQLIKN